MRGRFGVSCASWRGTRPVAYRYVLSLLLAGGIFGIRTVVTRELGKPFPTYEPYLSSVAVWIAIFAALITVPIFSLLTGLSWEHYARDKRKVYLAAAMAICGLIILLFGGCAAWFVGEAQRTASAYAIGSLITAALWPWESAPFWAPFSIRHLRMDRRCSRAGGHRHLSRNPLRLTPNFRYDQESVDPTPYLMVAGLTAMGLAIFGIPSWLMWRQLQKPNEPSVKVVLSIFLAVFGLATLLAGGCGALMMFESFSSR